MAGMADEDDTLAAEIAALQEQDRANPPRLSPPELARLRELLRPRITRPRQSPEPRTP